MGGVLDDVPADALEELAYLARSANRLRIMAALDAGAFGRRDLVEETEVAPATVGRIVNELEERGWAERRSDGTYTTTATGSLVVSEFAPLVDAMDTIRTLGEEAAWIPIDELSVGIEAFGDATVVRSRPNAPLESVDYLADAVRGASEFRALTSVAAPPPVGSAIEDGVLDGRLDSAAVLGGGLLGFLRDEPERGPDWQRLIEAGHEIYRYDGPVPCHLFVVDDSVLFMDDEPGGGGGFVVSEDASVLAAATGLFERYREDAESVDAGVFE